jgi:hypothetical protein
VAHLHALLPCHQIQISIKLLESLAGMKREEPRRQPQWVAFCWDAPTSGVAVGQKSLLDLT